MNTSRYVLCAAFGGFVGALAVQALTLKFSPTAEHLRTQAVELVDQHGNRRGLWNVAANGETSLAMLDANGAVKARFRLLPSGTPTVELYGDDGERTVAISTDSENRSSLTMRDSDRTRVVLGFVPNDAGASQDSWSLTFPSGAFKSHASMGVVQDSNSGKRNAFIALAGEQGKEWVVTR
jgi:hypothetical protein